MSQALTPLRSQRSAWALASVLLLHGAALWALQHGLLQRALEPVTPPDMLVEVTLDQAPAKLLATQQKPARAAEPAKALVAPPKPAQQSTQQPAQQPTATARAQEKPEPTLVAVANLAAPNAQPSPANPSAPSATAATGSSATAATSGSAATATTTAVASGSTTGTPTAPALQQPSSDADYLNNPKPGYPPMSRRLGEQGNVVVHTLIGADGVPQKAEILRSSGFERLDRAALETAMKWRYVPGKRAGVAEAMWFKVPLRFVLD